MSSAAREDRLYEEAGPSDQRSTAERDRDRILYSSALRRLVGVTQVVDPAEGHAFHNRLLHTFKVAQVGRRLAQKLLREQPEEARELGGIDPEVVEAAALAHDLGHPPFGHIAEKELDEMLRREGDMDGYEGNAQSFRILTKLAFVAKEHPGLNLTRATLNATLKYPWFRQTAGRKLQKWGAYHTEDCELGWTRELGPAGDQRSVEAELMDWADDITYAVHDLEDFYRAGLVPLHWLAIDRDERDQFLEKIFLRWQQEGRAVDSAEQQKLREATHELFSLIPIRQPYDSTADQRATLRATTSQLIKQYVFAIKLSGPGGEAPGTAVIQPALKDQVRILKELTWQYVITNPALAMQQYGKARIVRELFNVYMDVINKDKKWLAILPPRCQELLAEPNESASRPRIVADVISAMADGEAIAVYRKLSGLQPGSVLDLTPG